MQKACFLMTLLFLTSTVLLYALKNANFVALLKNIASNIALKSENRTSNSVDPDQTATKPVWKKI